MLNLLLKYHVTNDHVTNNHVTNNHVTFVPQLTSFYSSTTKTHEQIASKYFKL